MIPLHIFPCTSQDRISSELGRALSYTAAAAKLATAQFPVHFKGRHNRSPGSGEKKSAVGGILKKSMHTESRVRKHAQLAKICQLETTRSPKPLLTCFILFAHRSMHCGKSVRVAWKNFRLSHMAKVGFPCIAQSGQSSMLIAHVQVKHPALQHHHWLLPQANQRHRGGVHRCAPKRGSGKIPSTKRT